MVDSYIKGQMNMGKILFDFASYQHNWQFNGGAEYGNVVLKRLLSMENKGNGLVFFENMTIDEGEIKDVINSGWKVHPIRYFREILSIVKKEGYETIYSPLPYVTEWEYIGKRCSAKFIGTFHDVRNIETEYYRLSEESWFKENKVNDCDFIYGRGSESENIEIGNYKKTLMAFESKKIIAVSEYSKNALLYYFPSISLDEIETLYSPNKRSNGTLPDEEEKLFFKSMGVDKNNYGLLLGGSIYYKNALRGVLAFDSLFDTKREYIPDSYKVIVVGVNDPGIYMGRLRHIDRFVFLKRIETEKLESLYKNAHMLLYPSLSEGFGYPPIEAMKYGTICACSAGTSISEICGNMVVYFNPFLINEIAVAILKCFSNSIRSDLKQKIEIGLPLVNKRQEKDLDRLIEIITE